MGLRPKLSPQAGSVLVGDALVPHTELTRTAFYADFGRRFDIVRMIGATLEAGSDGMSVLSLSANERRQPFGAHETQLLQALVPHLQQSLRLHRQLLAAQQATEDLAGILECSSRAALLLDRAGQIVFMNDAASRLAAERDGLITDHGELRGSNARMTTQLRQLAANAIQHSKGSARGAGGVLALRRSGGRAPLAVFVSPMSRKQRPLQSQAAAALISVTDPEAAVTPSQALLREAFGLTPAEARLACALAEGLTLVDAGTRLGVRRETARSRLKTIFDKTGTHRQSQLIRLLIRLMP